MFMCPGICMCVSREAGCHWIPEFKPNLMDQLQGCLEGMGWDNSSKRSCIVPVLQFCDSLHPLGLLDKQFASIY